MNTIRNLLINLRSLLDCACELFRYARVFLWPIFCPRAVLAARLLAVESQLAACKHQIASKKHPRPRFAAGFCLLWVLLSKSLDKWEDLVHLMQRATVKKWHNTAFRYFWRWKSRRKGGRPPISNKMQNLIYGLSRENRIWSPERIRDTLLLLNYDPPCEDTIWKSCSSHEYAARGQLHGCHFCAITWMYRGQSISSQLRPSISPHCMFSLFLTMVAGRLCTLR